MLTDVILREATAEAERFRLSLVPEDGEPHVFSKRFERKMRKLIRRANHPIRYQVMRTAAAVALVIVTLFGAVMAVSPEARAAVVGWVKSAFLEFIEYSSTGLNTNENTDDTANNQGNEQIKYEYYLSVIPEGYWELKVAKQPDGITYLYVNDLGKILRFTYTYGAENSSLFVKTEDYEQHTSFVNNLPADIYIALKDNETSVIVWQDSQEGVIFEIFAMSDQAGLVTLAETIVKIQ